jgi:hypothetical protein
LDPSFKLLGQVLWESECVRVMLRPFNECQLNRDLAALCARVEARAPRLPDGRRLLLILGTARRLKLAVSPHQIA